LSYFLANLFIAVEKALTSTPLDLVDPPTAKKAIGAKGNAKKEDVLRAMEKIPELVENCETTLKDLDEHSLDSMAIAYYRLQKLRNPSI
jgi:Holliday junction resolvasome RuvABC endonuclease subunit